MLSKHKLLATLLGAEADETVILASHTWVEQRQIKTDDGKTVVEERREAGGEWVVSDWIKPDVTDWYWSARNAAAMGLKLPNVEWLGTVEEIPDEYLLADAPLLARRIDKRGWINVRTTVKDACEGEA